MGALALLEIQALPVDSALHRRAGAPRRAALETLLKRGEEQRPVIDLSVEERAWLAERPSLILVTLSPFRAVAAPQAMNASISVYLADG